VLIVALVVIGALLTGVALLWAFQRRLIFLPDAAAVPSASSLLAGAQDVTLSTEDGLMLRALYVAAPPSPCRATVLVAPGNAGHRGDRVPLAKALRAAGFGVLLLEYRGYGGNSGSPTEDGLALDGAAARAFLTGPAGLSPREVIYFGESLGGAVVTRLAVAAPPAGLLLRSPFTALADVAHRQVPFLPVRLLLRDRFPVAPIVGDVDAPVTVVFGTSDSLVPPEQSLAVARAAAGPAVEVAVDGAEHNDPRLAHGPSVIAAAVELAARAGCPPPAR
jgi:fermentation-respiration switch protein FrsA (DUF1100 family)